MRSTRYRSGHFLDRARDDSRSTQGNELGRLIDGRHQQRPTVSRPLENSEHMLEAVVDLNLSQTAWERRRRAGQADRIQQNRRTDEIGVDNTVDRGSEDRQSVPERQCVGSDAELSATLDEIETRDGARGQRH